MKVQQVFTPNDTPTVTYVDRSEHKLEQTLRDYCATPNIVVSLSGPSKSGKTVLIKKVVSEDLLIPVVGAGISSADNLWERVLHWMGTPTETTETKISGGELSAGAEGGGKAGIPLFAEGTASVSAATSMSWGSEKSVTTRVDALSQVIKEIAGSEFVVFIDDFHYIRLDVREEIGRQIKAAAENGVKIITASVPHRSDDVVRSNPELRGRVASLDLAYWTNDELIQIAEKGFSRLNVDLAPPVKKALASESFGSPQLMQSICLNLCYELSIKETFPEQKRIEVSNSDLTETLLRTSSFSDFSKMLTALHTGPRTRGTERKLHDFLDGSGGDVYRAILIAIKEDPAQLSFPYDVILDRVRKVCLGDPPVGSSVTSALEQMHIIAEEVQPGTSPISWDEATLDIADPYFLFFLRCSGKLQSLGQGPGTFSSGAQGTLKLEQS
ncbi:MAG: hypothetical protein E5X41_30580 [Mesorhizobium sp.]|nr:MAG: hypothetical protein E5X41_30580 [Mesorhizobium sp.]